MILASAGALSADRKAPPNLTGVIARLRLTSEGARWWLRALGVGVGSRERQERLLLIGPAGETALAVDGLEGHVALSAEVSERLDRDGAGLVLVHNHPRNTGLSLGDLMQLSRRGVSAIAAVGHDGSVFVAAAGPRYRPFAFARDQYGVARAEIERRLSVYLRGSSAAPWRDGIPLVFTHLVASALDRASVIQYRAFLSPALRRVADGVAAEGGRAAAGAAQRLRQGWQLQ
jgi:hypothetical protein